MKKWLLRISLGFLALLLLLYAFVFLRSVIPATVNDEGLRLERASIPEGSNAFEVLKVAASHLWSPDKHSPQIYDLLGSTNWDDALASTVLASNRETLAGWDAAAKLPDMQVPEFSKVDDASMLTYLSDWKRLAQLAMVRQNSLLHNGQDKKAFDQIVNHIRLGQQMQNADGVLICYLVGLAVENMGFYQMQHWVGKTHLTPAELKDYIRQLQSPPDATATAFANTMKAEYRCQTGWLVDMSQRGKFINPASGDNYPRPMRWLPAFKSSQTKALFAKGDLMLAQAASHHYNETKFPDLNSRPSLASMYLSGNAVGQITYYMMLPAVTAILAKKSQCDVQLQAARTILALRAYQLTQGRLPPDLDALVPEFLESVPVDDFNGQPLHYSAERKIVYSVGKNLKDDGGDDRSSDVPDSQRHLDLVYKFDF
jgi:hypothetical protein